MSFGTSAEALYAKLEREIAKSVADVDQLLLKLPPTPDSIPKTYDSTCIALKTLLVIGEKITAPDRIEKVLERLLPLAAAYTKLSRWVHSLSTTVKTSSTYPPVIAAMQAASLPSCYSRAINAAFLNVSTSQVVPGATLSKILEPLNLIDLTMPLIENAYEYLQREPYPPGSDAIKHVTRIFHGSLLQMFVLVKEVARFNTSARRSPSIKLNISKLNTEAPGIKYVTKDALCALMDKCTSLLISLESYGAHGLPQTDPYIEATLALNGLAHFSEDISGVPQFNSKHSLRVFYSKTYDECYVKAFEYFAEDGGKGKSFPEEEYEDVALGISGGLFLLYHFGTQENTVPAYKDALKFSGSHTVQDRVYNACLKIYNSALNAQKQFDNQRSKAGGDQILHRAAKLFALVAGILGAWGVKRLVSIRPGNPCSAKDVHPDLVAKLDILLAKAWTKLMQIFEKHGQPYSFYVDSTGFVGTYAVMRPPLYPCQDFLLDGQSTYLKADSNGEYTSLALRFNELEAMFNTLMMLPAHVRGYGDLGSVMMLKSTIEALDKFIAAFVEGGIFELPVGDKRYAIIWKWYKRVVLSALKAAKALVMCPMETWARLQRLGFEGHRSIEENQESVSYAVNRCLLLLLFLPEFGFQLGYNLGKDFIPTCSALSLVALDMLAYTPKPVWKRGGHRIQGYGHIATMVGIAEEFLKNTLPCNDKGLETLHKIAIEMVNELSNVGGDQPAGFGDREGELVRTNLTDVASLVEATKDNEEEDRQISCSMQRAKALSVLPCSCMTCQAVFSSVDQKKIASKVCSGCKVAKYCSAECQKKDWKVHKVACKALAAAGKS